jgi:hypothetical protein
MTARLDRKTSALVMLLAMACMGVCFASAQSNSDSSTNGSRQSAGATNMASQWTAGAKAFGTSRDQPWGNKNPSFDSANGTAWHPGTKGFSAGPQPGGIWVVPGAQATTEESTPQNASEGMMNPSTAGNSSLPGSSFVPPSSSLVAPGTGEKSFQKMNPSISATSSSAGQSFESSSNRWAASAIRPQMTSPLSARAVGVGMQSQGRTGSRSVRGFGLFGGSSMGQSSRMTVGSFKSSSRSFGGGGRIRGRSSGSRRSRGLARESLSESSHEQRRYSDSLQDTKDLHAGVGSDLGSQNQRLGSRGLESGVNKLGTANGRERLGKSRSNQGLNTHVPY